jgi:hypothetical protein
MSPAAPITSSSLRTQISRVITRDALFDIGADTGGLLVPGGSIAVKVARAAIDRSYQERTRATR